VAKSVPKTADHLIAEVLETALTRGSEIRLITVGKKPEGAGLFQDERGTRKAAIEQSLYGDPPLLKVVRTEEVTVGKRKQLHRFVAITPAGVTLLCSQVPPETAGDMLIQACAAMYQRLREEDAQLDRFVRTRQEILESAEFLAQQFADTAARLQASFRETAEKADLLKDRLASLPVPAVLLSTAPLRPPLRAASTEAEGQFRQSAAQQLVFAWQETSADREPLERALFNLGAEPLGQVGRRAEFSGRIHASSEPVFPGDPVEIVLPGWLLRDELGGYLLAHAQVKPSEKPAE
jgi:hypothetical protein